MMLENNGEPKAPVKHLNVRIVAVTPQLGGAWICHCHVFRGKAIPKARLLRSARNDTSKPSVRNGEICHCEAVRPWQSPKLWQVASLRSQRHSLAACN